ncbi:hypothetical protein OUZ56_023784 [Daphnia magna]|uniref:Uncharacterized protein n=1 Tax=Daphnia magna TaxID=35525 RepID=A0ABR0AZL3_9CRUS|nr:hypothetical protein OUZ56_023784 [Daphnia magna]
MFLSAILMSSADVYSVNNKNNIEHCNMCPILASCAYHNSPNTVFTRERIQIQVCYSMKTDATRGDQRIRFPSLMGKICFRLRIVYLPCSSAFNTQIIWSTTKTIMSKKKNFLRSFREELYLEKKKNTLEQKPDTEEISKCIVEEDIHTHVPCVLNLEEGETFHAEAINLQESAVPLELYLGRVHDDFSITDSELNNIEDMHFDGVKMKKHAKRMGQIADDWDEHWDQVFDAHTENVAVPCFIPAHCQSCRSINTLTLEPLKNKYMIVVTLLVNGAAPSWS